MVAYPVAVVKRVIDASTAACICCSAGLALDSTRTSTPRSTEPADANDQQLSTWTATVGVGHVARCSRPLVPRVPVTSAGTDLEIPSTRCSWRYLSRQVATVDPANDLQAAVAFAGEPNALTVLETVVVGTVAVLEGTGLGTPAAESFRTTK